MKQYKFNTIKLFMFVEIFYVLSLLSVTPHSPGFNLGFCEFIQHDQYYNKEQFLNCIINNGEEYWTAMEGYINMVCYTVRIEPLSSPTGSQSASPSTSSTSSKTTTNSI